MFTFFVSQPQETRNAVPFHAFTQLSLKWFKMVYKPYEGSTYYLFYFFYMNLIEYEYDWIHNLIAPHYFHSWTCSFSLVVSFWQLCGWSILHQLLNCILCLKQCANDSMINDSRYNSCLYKLNANFSHIVREFCSHIKLCFALRLLIYLGLTLRFKVLAIFMCALIGFG